MMDIIDTALIASRVTGTLGSLCAFLYSLYLFTKGETKEAQYLVLASIFLVLM